MQEIMVESADAYPSQATPQVTDRIDTDDLKEGWAEIGRTPRIMPTVKMGAKTDLGRIRENNEDKFDFYEPEDTAVLATKGAFYAVADGMGGHAAGQIACEMALKTVIQHYYDSPSADIQLNLKRAIEEANALVFDTAQVIPDRQNMGTTLTSVVIREDKAVIAQVGDSRAYLIRDGVIQQITEDHSWVAEQVRLGAMRREDAENSPFRNIITRSIGTSATVEADLFSIDLQVNDLIVLCSDGLSGHLDEQEILRIASELSPSVATTRLVEAANERGGRDNITVIALSIRALTPYSEEMTHTSVSEEKKIPEWNTSSEAEEKPVRRFWGRRRSA